MIEFCNKKRMAIAILVLILLSIVVLLIENNMSMNHDMKDATKPPENYSQECAGASQVNILKSCGRCNSFEKDMYPYCQVTGYHERIRCYVDGAPKELYRSCPKVSWLEERNFWVFEAVATIAGLGAYSIVCMRQKFLDRMLLEKVHKQIASGV